ncbi:MAG: cellulase-like family protein, partial [Bacteroides sp.]|nr:cellulase-like family protein [Bacteroides sp.]
MKEMQRRSFLNTSVKGFALAGMSSCISTPKEEKKINVLKADKNPGKAYAITMWDFSWVERRWPGAGYEDWDLALDELVERGYNAVRIDAFPHFVANRPESERTLIPVWNQEDWGSPSLNKITILPELTGFIAKCKDRNIKVGLSSWFREDAENIRMKILTPEIMAAWWVETVKVIEAAGLLDAILFVDLCNEWPGIFWAP